MIWWLGIWLEISPIFNINPTYFIIFWYGIYIYVYVPYLRMLVSCAFLLVQLVCLNFGHPYIHCLISFAYMAMNLVWYIYNFRFSDRSNYVQDDLRYCSYMMLYGIVILSQILPTIPETISVLFLDELIRIIIHCSAIWGLFPEFVFPWVQLTSRREVVITRIWPIYIYIRCIWLLSNIPLNYEGSLQIFGSSQLKLATKTFTLW